MNNNVRRNLILTGLIVLMISIIGLIVFSIRDSSVAFDEDTKTFEENTNDLSAWVAYWDLNSNKEIRALDKKVKNICYFAANFNSSDKLVMPQKLIDYYNETKSYEYNKYITIVNDKINSDGNSILKDTNLLKKLLGNSDSRSSHIKEIINLALKYDFDGIEIDYEQIKNDMKLWNDYILFINELYQKAEKENLKIRVVLEPSIPFDKLIFDEGPVYVVMCYNLHGGFSSPGGKANPKFIMELIEKTIKIPGKKDFAVATGGFNWAANWKTTAVSETEVNLILKEYKSKVKRDDESKCLFFNYKDKDSIEHEVWYADKITLKSWMSVIIEKGYDTSIWRLGWK